MPEVKREADSEDQATQKHCQCSRTDWTPLAHGFCCILQAVGVMIVILAMGGCVVMINEGKFPW
jgi:hypothetical protein